MPTPKGGTEQTGVAEVDAAVDNGEPTRKSPQLSARERALASMDAKILEQREADHAEALAAGNPIALALEAERLGQSTEDESFEGRTSPRAPVAAPSTRRIPEVSGMEDETEDPTPTELVAAVPRKATPSKAAPAGAAATADPLGQFVVVKDGKQMVRLMVDGREILMDADKARAQLQKGTAADVRLQQATQARKQLELDRAALASQEAAFAARVRTQPSAALPVDADPVLQTEARDLVKSLMSDTPDEAAAKMMKVLQRTRQAAPAVDEKALLDRATVLVKQSIKADDEKKDVVSGFAKFQTDYPEIAEDPKLFQFADNLSEAIKTEHPTWAPSQIMAEAGKQTREWVNSLTGGPRPKDPTPKPAIVPAVNNRLAAKQNLRPMPVVRAVQRSAEAQAPANAPVAPADVLAEIRRSRGQAA